MLPIASQTAGPNGLTLFVDTHGWPVGVTGLKHLKFFFHFFFIQIFFSTGNTSASIQYTSYFSEKFINFILPSNRFEYYNRQ